MSDEYELPVAEVLVEAGETVLNIYPASRPVDLSKKDFDSSRKEA